MIKAVRHTGTSETVDPIRHTNGSTCDGCDGSDELSNWLANSGGDEEGRENDLHFAQIKYK